MARRFPTLLTATGAALVLAVLTPGTATAAAPRFAAAADATITPGSLMVTMVDNNTTATCTAAFVFSAGSAVYLGFAAHCTSAEESPSSSGCDNRTLPLGTPVAITGKDGNRNEGRLAYSSWRSMQDRHETDEALCLFNDLALVELAPETVAAVNPSVPVLGGPSGLATGAPASGESVYSFQPNNGGTEVKEGQNLGTEAMGLTHLVQTAPPGGPGDSGAGYLDASGRAFGVLSTQFDDRRHTNGVTDLPRALSYANRFGGLGTITLVPGTEPFRPG